MYRFTGSKVRVQASGGYSEKKEKHIPQGDLNSGKKRNKCQNRNKLSQK